MNNIGAQLYTVRDLLSSDEQTVETLKKIKALGYTAVQFFGGKDRIISMGKAAKETGLKVQGVLSDIKTYLDMGDELFDLAKEYNIPIRIGINSGSVEKHLLEKYNGPTPEAMLESITNHVRLLESLDFYDIVLSIKSTNIENTINKLPNIFTKDQIREIHPYVSESTINRALQKLRDENKIKPLGKGRSAKWRKISLSNI